MLSLYFIYSAIRLSFSQTPYIHHNVIQVDFYIKIVSIVEENETYIHPKAKKKKKEETRTKSFTLPLPVGGV